MNTEKSPVDANALEEMAKANPDETFLKGSGVLKLTGAIRTLESTLAAKDAEIAECDALREKMADILSRTAIALKGPNPELGLHSWHDLPECVLALTAERDALATPVAAVGLVTRPTPMQAVYLVATGATHEDLETYTRHDERPPLCDAERLYSAAPAGELVCKSDALTALAAVTTERDTARSLVDGYINDLRKMTAERDTLAAQLAQQKPVIEAAEEWWSERSPEDWAEGNLMKALATMNGDWEGCEGCNHECGESCMPATVAEIHASVDKCLKNLDKKEAQ